jgi:3',5'-cyclic AMP phosphodiesterase CpdA
MARVIFLSDLHLSPTHGFFWENWRIARDWTNEQGADLVVINGDLCINGPDSDAEMAFAAKAVGKLRPPLRALPGNHDVGDEPPGQDPNQLVDADRLDRWTRAFGTDRFAVDVGAWRLIGLNAQLFGCGLAQEAEQYGFLAAELAAATGPVAIVLHKPLFLNAMDEAVPTIATLTPAPRARLLAMLHGADVRLVVSGHLHSHRDIEIDGIRWIWLPALAFAGAGGGGGTPMVAALSLDLTGEAAVAELHHLDGLVAHDLAAIKTGYAFLRDMPECPPPAESCKRS